MKRIVLLLSALSCALWATSCCPFGDDNDNVVTIDPVEYPMFEFDEQGIPYRWEHPLLDEAMLQTIRREFFGYGWKWMQTNEIDSAGCVIGKDYYLQLLGASPTSYYLQSDSVLQGYLISDAVGKYAFWEGRCRFDPSVGDLAGKNSSSDDDDAFIYFRIWSVYQLNGKWYMLCVMPLSVRNDGHGRYRQVWGASQYVRMSDTELLETQQKYSWQIR